jgi:acyl-CoA synthetase (AMP-forming)/AMP-acid ligase II/thioesterase domain-containing protein/acyl carrier protein
MAHGGVVVHAMDWVISTQSNQAAIRHVATRRSQTPPGEAMNIPTTQQNHVRIVGELSPQLSFDTDATWSKRMGKFSSITDLLFHAADTAPNAGVHCVNGDAIDDSAFQDYASLVDGARRMLGGLHARRLPVGKNIVLLLERSNEFIPAFWACLLGGYIPCPLLPIRADTTRWATQFRHVNDLLDSPLWLTTSDINAELSIFEDTKVTLFDELLASEPASRIHNPDPSDLAILMLTSGSTGNSKAVMLSHGNLLSALAGKADRLELAFGDSTMNWISFDHIAAIEGHLLPLMIGATQLQVEPPVVLTDPLRFLWLIETYQVRLTFSPNFLLGQINTALDKKPDGFSANLESLRYIISGGEAVVCATGRRYLELLRPFGLRQNAIVPGFGMTETCAGSIFSREFPDVTSGREFASVGLPIDGLEIRIVDDNGWPLGECQIGELQLRGPVVTSGYFNNERATADAFTVDGWFCTGDRGYLEAGRLTLAGRSKDSVIVNGVNYFSHNIEAALEQLDGVENSYVAAFPTRPVGSDTEELIITIVPSPSCEGEADLHRLLVAIRSTVVMHWGFRPTLVLPLPKSEIPKTSLGKIQKSVLRRKLEAGDFAGYVQSAADLTLRQIGGYSAPEGSTEVELAEIYAGMFGLELETVSATASFFDLGGTSLEILQLKKQVESRFNIADVPTVALLRAPTVRQLAGVLAALGQGTPCYDPLVPLQPTGTKTPLFCVHPGVGEVLVFVNLAKYFLNERPFYALRARGFGVNEDYFHTFDEMVQCYVQAIRSKQPHGPYAVAGYSYGGIIAFEIAKVLEAAGESVEFVGIFNLPPHIQNRMHEIDFAEGAVNLAFFLGLVTKDQAAKLPQLLRNKNLSKDEIAEYLVGMASKARLAELDINVAKFAAWANLAQSLVELGRAYEPSGTVKSVSVFYAIPLRGTKEAWLKDQLMEWENFTRGPNRYIDVAGEHYTLMGPQHVASFQATLRKELDRALGGA